MKINSIVRRITNQPIFVDRNGNELSHSNKIKIVNNFGKFISKGNFKIGKDTISIFYSYPSKPDLKINEKIKFSDWLKLKDFGISKSDFENNTFYCFGFIKI